jgi:hypothetical protein
MHLSEIRVLFEEGLEQPEARKDALYTQYMSSSP